VMTIAGILYTPVGRRREGGVLIKTLPHWKPCMTIFGWITTIQMWITVELRLLMSGFWPLTARPSPIMILLNPIEKTWLPTCYIDLEKCFFHVGNIYVSLVDAYFIYKSHKKFKGMSFQE
jgi:hypothetical protein